MGWLRTTRRWWRRNNNCTCHGLQIMSVFAVDKLRLSQAYTAGGVGDSMTSLQRNGVIFDGRGDVILQVYRRQNKRLGLWLAMHRHLYANAFGTLRECLTLRDFPFATQVVSYVRGSTCRNKSKGKLIGRAIRSVILACRHKASVEGPNNLHEAVVVPIPLLYL